MVKEKVEIFHVGFTYKDERGQARESVQAQYNEWMEENGHKIQIIERQFHASPGNVDITLYYSEKATKEESAK